jgi:AcrR family transcriptional regulator
MTATEPARNSPPSPPRPMRADARRNYERLVAVATEAFLQDGAGASLDDIAKRAGVGPGTLYRHFPVRQDLINAVLEGWMQEVLTEAEPLLRAEDPARALRTWLRRLVTHIMVFRGLTAALLTPEPGQESPGRVLHTTAGELVTRAQDSGQIRRDVDSMDVLMLISGIAWACSSGKTVNTDKLVDLIMDGLRVQDA